MPIKSAHPFLSAPRKPTPNRLLAAEQEQEGAQGCSYRLECKKKKKKMVSQVLSIPRNDFFNSECAKPEGKAFFFFLKALPGRALMPQQAPALLLGLLDGHPWEAGLCTGGSVQPREAPRVPCRRTPRNSPATPGCWGSSGYPPETLSCLTSALALPARTDEPRGSRNTASLGNAWSPSSTSPKSPRFLHCSPEGQRAR